MRRFPARTGARVGNPRHAAPRLALLVLAAGLLAGCETTGDGPTGSIAPPGHSAQASEPAKVEPPMTRARAASDCWMKTEKGRRDIDLDKRADIVIKCIDDRMKAAAAPKP